MPIYELSDDNLNRVKEATFAELGLKESDHIKRLLRDQFEVISPETLIIDEEFCDWEDSRRRIDLLGLDKQANLIVIEIKRTEDGGHMELQAIRYAGMVSTMTFDKAVDVYGKYLERMGIDDEPGNNILNFLEWEEPDEDSFAQDVRIFLISAEFSKEITTAVLWLNERGLDIRCIRIRPYINRDQIMIDIQQIIPLPEAAEYQIKVKEKARKERRSQGAGPDYTKYDVEIKGVLTPSLNKRRALLCIARGLCQNGVEPEQVTEAIAEKTERNPNRIRVFVDGEVKGDDFVKLITQKRAEEGKSFNRGRWFCGDEELIFFNNKTYAFSNQWGSTYWMNAMEQLKSSFPDFDICFEPVD